MEDAAVAEILGAIRATPRMVVTSHARPDGDAVGSVLAMGAVLEGMGCEAEMVLADPVPVLYRFLPGVERIRCVTTLDEADSSAGSREDKQREQAKATARDGEGYVPTHRGETAMEGAPGGLGLGGGEQATADSLVGARTPVLLLECDCTERTGLVGFEGRCLINIDHHASGKKFGALNWIDDDACAVAAMVYRLAVAAGVEISPEMATCLYTAVLSDTGSFTYPGTDRVTFALAHELVRLGARPNAVAQEVYFSNPESKIRLLGRALGTMQCEGGVAWAWVTQDAMEEAGAVPEDCEGVVNYLIGIAGVECAAFLREMPDRRNFRLSIRSKGRVDVAKVAEGLGGGGHRSASGCTMAGPLEVATERIVRELSARLASREAARRELC